MYAMQEIEKSECNTFMLTSVAPKHFQIPTYVFKIILYNFFSKF